MNKLNLDQVTEIELVKHYIKDLSFENPQSISENNAENNNNNSISVNANFIYKPFNDNFFSLIMKYYCECSSIKNNNKLFILELDYFGFFKIINNKLDETELTQKGAELIIPFSTEFTKLASHTLIFKVLASGTFTEATSLIFIVCPYASKVILSTKAEDALPDLNP